MREGPRCRGLLQASRAGTTGKPRGALTLSSQRVRVVVTGGLAHTEVEAELANDEAEAVDPLLSFLLPEAASPILGSELELWGDEARFARIVRLPAKQRRTIRLSYDEPLEQRSGRQVYRFAISGAGCAVAPLGQFSIEVTLLGSPAGIGRIAASQQAQIWSATDRVTVKLEHQHAVPNGDFTIEFDGRAPSAVDAQVANGFVGLNFSLPESKRGTPSNQASTHVLVLDKSYHQSPATLQLQARIVERILKQATARERFRLLACDSACSERPNDVAAATWLASLSPSGSFDLEGALAHARRLLRGESRGQLVYLGRGQVSAGTLEKSALVESCARLVGPAVDLRVFALGRQNHRSVAFDLAVATNGTYAVVSDTLPLELTVDELLRSLRSPKLTGVRVQLPSGLTETTPQRWPALVPGLPLRVGARVAGATSGAMRISGKLEGRAYAQTYPVTLSDATPQNPAVERWWEQQRLAGRAQVAPGTVTPPVKPALLPSIKATTSDVTASEGPPREGGPDRQREVQVVASRFHRCYERLAFGPEGWFEDRLDFALQVDARGALTSFAAEASSSDAPPSLLECLHQAAARPIFEPPRLAPIELWFSQQIAIDWSRGLRADVEVPAGAPTSQGPILTTISPGDDGRQGALAANALGPVLGAKTPAQMLDLAQKLATEAPRSQQALDLLAAVAGSQQQSAIVRAMQEAELTLVPHDRDLRLRAARAWLAIGDEQRACAHVRAASGALSSLEALAAGCRKRWLGDALTPTPSAAMSERALADLDAGTPCQPFKVNVSCNGPASCPTAVVLTPQGQVVSPFGRIPGAGQASPLGFWPGGFGSFRVLLLGGKPTDRGTVTLSVHLDTKQFEYERAGVAQNVATVELRAEKPSHFAFGMPLCGSQ